MEYLFQQDSTVDAWSELDTSLPIPRDHNPLLEDLQDMFFRENPGMREVSILSNPYFLPYTAWLLLNFQMMPFQATIMNNFWHYPFPMLIGGRGISKSTLLALYALLKSFLVPEYRIIIAGASFRQSQHIFNEMIKWWSKGDLFRHMCSNDSKVRQGAGQWEFIINDSLVTAIPIGHDGGKVRGYRSYCTIVDEFKDHNPTVVEEVLFGFGVTAANPAQAAADAARKQKMKEAGYNIADTSDADREYANQGIISGTADYYFNHFYDYWKRYCAIIRCKGDYDKLRKEGIDMPEEYRDYLNYKDFCVMRLPYDIIPKGFQDMKMIMRQKTQMTNSLFMKEYGATFVEDSGGFFNMKGIDEATATEVNVKKPDWISYCPAPFDIRMKGNPDLEYIMAVDTAIKNDNFAISILENYADHARVVYSWTTNEKDFVSRKHLGLCDFDDFYAFTIRKIRNLMADFNIVKIGIDSQNAGETIIHGLRNKKFMYEGEQQIWEIIETGKDKETDNMDGLHILVPIHFANSNWMSTANHGLLASIVQKTLLFPRFDSITGELAAAHDSIFVKEFESKNPGQTIKRFDTMEDCIEEVESLKKELASIQYTRTGLGVNSREKWVLPEQYDEENKKIVNKKDRYSALLMSNYIACEIRKNKIMEKKPREFFAGGHISSIKQFSGANVAFTGSSKFAKMNIDEFGVI